MIRRWRVWRLNRLAWRSFEEMRMSMMTVSPEERHFWRLQHGRTQDKIERLRRKVQLGRGSFSAVDEWRP